MPSFGSKLVQNRSMKQMFESKKIVSSKPCMWNIRWIVVGVKCAILVNWSSIMNREAIAHIFFHFAWAVLAQWRTFGGGLTEGLLISILNSASLEPLILNKLVYFVSIPYNMWCLTFNYTDTHLVGKLNKASATTPSFP